MNEQERADLEWLKRRQTRLLEEVQTLSKQIEAVEKRLSPVQPEVQASQKTLLTPSLSPGERKPAAPGAQEAGKILSSQFAPPSQAHPVPPRPVEPKQNVGEPPVVKQESAGPQAIPPIIQPARAIARPAEPSPLPKQPAAEPVPRVASSAEPMGKSEPVKQTSAQAVPAAMPPAFTPPPSQPKQKKPDAASIEMRLGTYWLVRIGIVMLVTGLVFFGNLAYHHIISRIGPGGKVGLLYFASALLLGAGWWWQRKPGKESLKNYAEVLFAGGLASVYFTTFAAHHIERLQVIRSPGLDGLLLLLWAGFIVWIADRKKSQVLALFAVLLAYYSLIITRVEVFTLYSNLVLTAAAVFFLVRNRWAVLSFVGLGATYAAYGYWRFCNGQEWHFPEATDLALWKGIWFLIGYWVIFTAGVFLTRDKEFAGAHRTSFLTANNGAFFAMFLLTMVQVHQGGFWKFALFYGSALLVLAVAARAVLPDEPLVRNSYLTQGLLLATVGIICHPNLAGLNLSLVLATESVTLLFTGLLRKNKVLTVGAYLAAILAVGWGMDGMMQHERHGMWLAIGLGFMMLVNTLVADWSLRKAGEEKPPRARVMRPQPAYFIVLALAVWLVATWNNAARVNFTFVLTIEAMVLILSIYLFKVPEISLLSLGYLGIAQLVWLCDAFNGVLTLPSWNPVLMMALNIAMMAWWHRQKVLNFESAAVAGALTPAPLAVPGKNLVLVGGTHLAVTLAGGWDFFGGGGLKTSGLSLPIILGALLLIDCVIHRHRPVPPAGRGLELQSVFSITLALVVALAVTWHHLPRPQVPLVMAAEAIVLILSIYALRVPEISFLSLGYLGIAQLLWLSDGLNEARPVPWWNPPLMLALSMGIVVWWRRQNVLKVDASPALAWLKSRNLPNPGKNIALLAATLIAVRLAGGWEFGSTEVASHSGLVLPAVLGVMVLLDGVVYGRRSAAEPGRILKVQPAYSTILALIVGFAVTWHHTTREAFPLVLACEAAVLTASYYVLRVPEITLFSQSYLVLAQIAWMAWFGMDHHRLPPWWNPVLLIGISLAVSHWWQKQKVLGLPSAANLFWQGLYALAIVGVLYYWGSGRVEAPTWLALTTLLAVGLTAYGAATRAWLLAAFGQIFMIISAVQFIEQLAQGKPVWWVPLAPMAGIAALVYGTTRWFEQRPDAKQQIREPLTQAALVYRWAAMIMSVCWVCKYIPDHERVWFFVALGLITFLLGGWRKSVEVLIWGAVYTACGIAWLWLPGHENSIVYLPNFLAVAAVLAQQRIAKLFEGRYALAPQVHGTAITVGGLSLWFLVTRWVWEVAERDSKLAGLMTASWCVLALVLFTCGILTREKAYRWLGLGVLTC